MELVGLLLLFAGLIVMLVGGIWCLVLAFQTNIWWGLGSLFIPFVLLVFVIMHWTLTKKPFLIWLGGFVPYIIGIVMVGMTTGEMSP